MSRTNRNSIVFCLGSSDGGRPTGPFNVKRSSCFFNEGGELPESIDHLLAFTLSSSRPWNGLDVDWNLVGFLPTTFEILFENFVDDGGPLACDLRGSRSMIFHG